MNEIQKGASKKWMETSTGGSFLASLMGLYVQLPAKVEQQQTASSNLHHTCGW